MRFGWRAPTGHGASARRPEHFQAFLVRQKATKRGHFTHFDGVTIETCEDPVKPRHVAVIQ
jgi:hypothetical protein